MSRTVLIGSAAPGSDAAGSDVAGGDAAGSDAGARSGSAPASATISARSAGEAGVFVVRIGGDAGGEVEEVRVLARRSASGHLVVTMPDGRRFVAAVSPDAARPERSTWVSTGGRTWRVDDVEEASARGGAAGGLEAPMPGKVLEVQVGLGDRVEQGQTLLVVEAMKMEHAIKAPYAGVVLRIAAAEGDMVSPGSPLVDIEADTA